MENAGLARSAETVTQVRTITGRDCLGRGRGAASAELERIGASVNRVAVNAGATPWPGGGAIHAVGAKRGALREKSDAVDQLEGDFVARCCDRTPGRRDHRARRPAADFFERSSRPKALGKGTVSIGAGLRLFPINRAGTVLRTSTSAGAQPSPSICRAGRRTPVRGERAGTAKLKPTRCPAKAKFWWSRTNA